VAVVKEREYPALLQRLTVPPDIVVCDSQVVLKMVGDTPPGVKCTTFSILFSRNKGDLVQAARGAAVLAAVRPGDRILVAEACSHHAIEDDIGRVKIPRWLRQFAGADLQVDHCAGKDYPENLRDYSLVIHCGGCMLNRREMLSRMESAREEGVPVTNYGVAISVLQGVVERTLSPFPAALDAYLRERKRLSAPREKTA
jgi:[FeFe] hydrogenase H-cluster maturation GTPase HydF